MDFRSEQRQADETRCARPIDAVKNTLQTLVQSLGQHGDRTALLGMGARQPQPMSYVELRDQVARLATGLAAAGLAPGQTCVVSAPNCPEWIVSCLALLEAGALPVPVDSQAARQDLEHILTDCRAAWVFTTAQSARRFSQQGTSPQRLVLLDEAAEAGIYWQELLAPAAQVSATEAAPEDAAMLFYTSGTSGLPKGVALSHANIMSNLSALLAQDLVLPDDRLLLPLPLHHVYPFVVGLLVALSAGLGIVLPRSLTGAHLQRALQQGEPSILLGVPRLYEALLTAIEQQLQARSRAARVAFWMLLKLAVGLRRTGRLDMGTWLFKTVRQRVAPRLRLMVSGGAALDPELAWALEGLGWRVATGYGLTETSPIVSLNLPGARRFDTAGRALPGVQVRTSAPAPGLRYGEVLVKGPNVFGGYHRLSVESAQAFTPDGWFRTGDLGFLDSHGYLHLRGRASSMIVLPGGENINPERLEETLAACPSIRELGVLAYDDKLVGVAVPTPEAARNHDWQDLQRQLIEEIARLQRGLPSYQHLSNLLIDVAPLTRTRLGKLRRQALLQRYRTLQSGARRAPREGVTELADLAVEDRQLLEDPVGWKLWNWLRLRFPSHALRPDTSLPLDLQIDSLDWLNLTLEIRDRVGVELGPEAVGRVETIRDLLREVIAAEGAPTSAGDFITTLRDPEAALSDSQRAWFAPRSLPLRLLGVILMGSADLLMRGFFRLRIAGAEHLPARAPFLLTPNHVSALDPIALMAVLGRRRLRETYWGGWVGIMFDRPLMRLVSRAMRVLPVEASRGSLWSLELAAAALSRGHALVWFPEGGRSPTGALRPFRAGVGLLLQAHPVPVVPVWIQGTRDALPPGRLWPMRRRLSITLGAVIEPRYWQALDSGAATPERIAAALQGRVQALGDAERRRAAGAR